MKKLSEIELALKKIATVIQDRLSTKQDALTAGTGITIAQDGTISATQDISGKENRMVVVTQSSGTTLTAAVDNYYRLTYSVGTLAVTLPAPTGSNTQSVLFFLTAGSSPNVTFTSSGNDVYYSDGFSIDASSTYEINALWNGAAWIITAVKINIV